MSDWCPENDGAYRAEMAAMYPVANRKRIAELEERYRLVAGDKIDLRGRVDALEAENRELAMQCLASDGQAQMAYEEQVRLEAKLAKLEAAPLPLPRPDSASTWEIDPEFVMDVAHAIQREEGWDVSMEAVELAMLAAEKHILQAETRRATLAELKGGE